MSADRNPAHRPVYLYVHIPKTAGTTLRLHLMTRLQPATRIISASPTDLDDDAAFLSRSQTELDACDVVLGHGVSRHAARFFPDREARFFTVLREPVAHAISRYNWSFREEPGVVKQPPAFEDWFKINTRNPMCRWLLTRYHRRMRVALPRGEYDDDRLFGEARDILQTFWCVAQTEQLERTAAPIFDALDAPGRIERNYRIAGEEHRKLVERTPDLEAFIRERSGADLRLYAQFFGEAAP